MLGQKRPSWRARLRSVPRARPVALPSPRDVGSVTGKMSLLSPGSVGSHQRRASGLRALRAGSLPRASAAGGQGCGGSLTGKGWAKRGLHLALSWEESQDVLGPGGF